MKFIMLADWHLESRSNTEKLKEQLKSLCKKIRTESSPLETVLFICMGDLINKGNEDSYADACECLNYIRHELKDYPVTFEFIPGNHDLPAGDIEPFDRFISEFGGNHAFGRQSVYSKVYDGVNFIFADTNLARNHQAPGQLDMIEVRAAVSSQRNLLFTHHGLTHNFGGGHDVVHSGNTVLNELEQIGIHFIFHAHTHRSAMTAHNNGIVEIGCGSLSHDLHDMDGIPNQFTVGYIHNGNVVRVERFVITKDGETIYPKASLYPEEKTFVDPNSLNKQKYVAIPNYIPRKVLPHSSVIGDNFLRFISKKNEITLKDALMENEKLLFLSDAGKGKSIEMENLAYQLGETAFFPYLFHLRNYTGSSINNILPSYYNELSPYCLVLLFDGYDELQVQYRKTFETQLNIYVEHNPGVRIVISSRSNFCKSENDNESRTFKGFKIYDLCELSNEDINDYLVKQSIDSHKFISQATYEEIEQLLSNPFYLSKLTSLYKKSGALPKKVALMDKLIEANFDTDDQKFAISLEDNYQSYINLLMQIAFAMQLMRQSKLVDRTEYQRLFDSNARELIKHSGLLVKEGDSWQFIHNNFREYLTAKFLSKMTRDEVISYIRSGDDINPSWVNTLGYLNGIQLSWDLVEWFTENAPNALVKFEPDRLEPTRRYEVFTRIFNYYEDKHLWFRDELCSAKELAHFSESDSSLTFLLGKIAHPIHTISQYTAISLLRHYRNLYGRQHEVRNCLLDCCKSFPQIRYDVCARAISVLARPDLSNNQVTRQLIATFADCDDSYIRSEMYEYLLETQEHNQYVQYFLKGIRYIEHNYMRQSDRVGNESFHLVDGLKKMSTMTSIIEVLLWFASKERTQFHGDDEVFSHILSEAKRLYTESPTELYNAVLHCCITSLQKHDRQAIKGCTDFFVYTHTLDAAIEVISNTFEKNMYCVDNMLYSCPEAFQYIKTAYINRSYNDHDTFKRLVLHSDINDKEYALCSNILKERSGMVLPLREPKIDYHAEQRKGRLIYLNALMSKESAEAMLRELISSTGRYDLLIEDIIEATGDVPWYSPLDLLRFAVCHWSSDRHSMAISFFNDCDLNYFAIVEYYRVITDHTDTIMTPMQREYIEALVAYWLDNDILKKQVQHEAGTQVISYLVAAVVFLAQYLDLSINENHLLDMTLIDEHYFGESSNKRKYEYLKKHIGRHKLIDRILENLELINLSPSLLSDHIAFCGDEMCDQATMKALEFCNDGSINKWVRSTSLEYLYKLYGADYIEHNVLPHAKGDFLLQIYEKCNGISRVEMRSALEKEFANNPTDQLMAHLITLGSAIAVEAYVEEVTASYRIPKHESYPMTPTQAIKSVCNPDLLPLLGKLIDVVLNPGFEDATFFSLQSALIDALLNCGKEDPDATMSTITEHQNKLGDTEEVNRFCNYVKEEISFHIRKVHDRPWSIEEVECWLRQCR